MFSLYHILFTGNTGINEDSGLRKYDMQSRINGRRVTYMLVIRYLAEEDAGDYLCTIRIQGVQWPEWPKKIGKLTVQSTYCRFIELIIAHCFISKIEAVFRVLLKKAAENDIYI